MPRGRGREQGSGRRNPGRAVRAALAGAWVAAGAVSASGTGPARAQVASSGQVVTGPRLQRMSPAELDAVYRASAPGVLPRGSVYGLPIVAPGTSLGPAMSRGARVVWQGKVFDDGGASAVNRFFGLTVIRGNLSLGPSWLDGRPSLILDYQGTSLVYGRYRDEIRQVAPGVYLGVMFARTKEGPSFSRYFAFETRP